MKVGCAEQDHPRGDPDSTLLYTLEVKFYFLKTDVDRTIQTSIPDFFVAEDGAGLSWDLVNSSATGILAARGILSCIGKK